MSESEWNKVIEVRWADVDLSQHLRHSAYADYATHVRVEWLNHFGFGPRKLAELLIAPVITEDRTQYLKEIRLSERVRVDLEVVGISDDASQYFFRQHFQREDGKLCARYEIKGSWLNLTTRRRSPPPEGILHATQHLKKAADFGVLPAAEPRST